MQRTDIGYLPAGPARPVVLVGLFGDVDRLQHDDAGARATGRPRRDPPGRGRGIELLDDVARVCGERTCVLPEGGATAIGTELPSPQPMRFQTGVWAPLAVHKWYQPAAQLPASALQSTGTLPAATALASADSPPRSAASAAWKRQVAVEQLPAMRSSSAVLRCADSAISVATTSRISVMISTAPRLAARAAKPEGGKTGWRSWQAVADRDRGRRSSAGGGRRR